MSNAVFRDGAIPDEPIGSVQEMEDFAPTFAIALVRWLIAIIDDDSPDLPTLLRLGSRYYAQGKTFTEAQTDKISHIHDRVIDLAAAGKLASQSKAGAGSVKFDLKSADMMGSC